MPNLGAFPHGVSWSDVPTSVIAPVQADAGVNVVFGAAPLHLSKNGKNYINKPRIYNRYEDAVAELGFSNDWATYDLCEHMDAVFVEFGVFPVVYVAVNDSEAGATTVAPVTKTLVGGQVDTGLEMILWTVVVKDETGTLAYVEGKDYLLTISKNNTVVITRIATGDIPDNNSIVTVEGKEPSVTPLTSADIIGGIDVATGARTGLGSYQRRFPATGKVPA